MAGYRIRDGEELLIYSTDNTYVGSIKLVGQSLILAGAGQDVVIDPGNNLLFNGSTGVIGGTNSILSLGNSGDTIALDVAGVTYKFLNISPTGVITPSYGSATTEGIEFPANLGGGSGDRAWLKYYVVSGEATRLELGVANDTNDDILLTTSGPLYLRSTSGVYLDTNNYLIVPVANGVRNFQATGDTSTYIGLKSHSSHTWLRNQAGVWTFQPGTDADSWTRTVQLYMPRPTNEALNDQWVELGQRQSNTTAGTYRGIYIVKYVAGAVTAGDLVVGDIYGPGVLSKTYGVWRFGTSYPNHGIFYTEGGTDSVAISPSGGGTTTPDLKIEGDGTITVRTTLKVGSDTALDTGDFTTSGGNNGTATTVARGDHNHDNRYYTETELNTKGGGGQVHWDNITSKSARDNLLHPETWKVGDAEVSPNSDYFTSLSSSVNTIVQETGPNGILVPCWKVTDPSLGNFGGGYNTSNFPVKDTCTYRFTVFYKKKIDQNGTLYFGCDTSGNTYSLAGVVDTNPYFWSGDLPTLDDWYLCVGYVHHKDYTGASIGGIYDMKGNKVVSFTDYKLKPGATTQYARSYMYYVTSGAPELYIYGPRVEVVDGTELPILSLLPATISGKINSSEKGANNGVATLGSDGKVPGSQLPGALMKAEPFTAASGQTLFTLTLGSYAVGANSLQVYVGGIRQHPNAYAETSSTSFTLSAGVTAGVPVLATWFEQTPYNIASHASSHAPGGGDELSAYYVPVAHKGAASGVATLDSSSKLVQDASTWGTRKSYKQSSAPTIGAGNAQAGDEWYDTANNRLKYCNGTSWVDPLKYQ